MKKTLFTGAVAVALAISGAYWIETIWPFSSSRKALEGVSENRGKIDHLEVRVEGVEGDVGALQGEVGALETTVESQEVALASHVVKIDGLKQLVEGLRTELGSIRDAQRAAEAQSASADRDREAIVQNLEAMAAREQRMQRVLDGLLDRLGALEKAFGESRQP